MRSPMVSHALFDCIMYEIVQYLYNADPVFRNIALIASCNLTHPIRAGPF